MNDPAKHPLESVLHLCAQAAPDPWYPSVYAKESGNARESLDPYLDQLRMGGLIHLTDWVQGRGQGYALTPAGEKVVQNPRLMARLLAGKFVAAQPEAAEDRSRVPTPFDRGEAARAAFLYPSQPIVTYILVAINIAIFAGENFSPQNFPRLSVTGLDILRGEWWRLISNCFVHANIFHIACNMYALTSLGRVLEQMWGRWRYLTIYLIAGLAGSCAGLMANPIGLVGASGAICGIFAAEAAWMYLNRRFLPSPFMRAWKRNFVVNLMLLTFISFIPGISGAAHLGGAVAGFVVALLLYFFQYEVGLRRVIAAVGVLAVPVISLLLLERSINSSPKWQELVRGERRGLHLRGQNEGDRQQDRELREFEEKHLPEVRRLEKAAMEGVNRIRVIKVRGHNPKEWTAADVEASCETLALARQKLSAALLRLQEIGPYQDDVIEEARQTRLNQIEAEMKFLQMQESHLRRGDNWTDEEQKMLEEQSDLALEMRRRWQALIK